MSACLMCRCAALMLGASSSPRPSQGRVRVALYRHRGLPLRLQAPPNGERQVLRPRVKAEPFGWPGGQPGHSDLRGSQVSGQFAVQFERRRRVHAGGLLKVTHAALVLDGEEEAFHAPHFGG